MKNPIEFLLMWLALSIAYGSHTAAAAGERDLSFALKWASLVAAVLAVVVYLSDRPEVDPDE